MTIQDWGAIGELVGALAVVATLIYLSIQIRLSISTQRAQTQQQLADGRRELLRMMFEFPLLREAWMKTLRGEEVTTEDLQELFWFTMLQVRNYENELRQCELGMIDEDELRVQRQILLQPTIQIEEVAKFKNSFTPRMQAELDKLIVDRKADK